LLLVRNSADIAVIGDAGLACSARTLRLESNSR